MEEQKEEKKKKGKSDDFVSFITQSTQLCKKWKRKDEYFLFFTFSGPRLKTQKVEF